MELFGFLGLADGVRPTAAAAVADLRSAGVSVVMITGDHPSTAAAIAEELHILNGAPVLTGADLDAWDDDELDAMLGEATVFARVTPAHKMRIIRAYQRIGRTVAMTGDGANDAPAIRLAHTGIALGGRGSPAAREAADLVVLDDRIETVIDAIVEGRAMWASVRDALGHPHRRKPGRGRVRPRLYRDRWGFAARGAPDAAGEPAHRHAAGDDNRLAFSSAALTGGVAS